MKQGFAPFFVLYIQIIKFCSPEVLCNSGYFVVCLNESITINNRRHTIATIIH